MILRDIHRKHDIDRQAKRRPVDGRGHEHSPRSKRLQHGPQKSCVVGNDVLDSVQEVVQSLREMEKQIQLAMCSVFPARIWMACGKTSITACNDSTAPAGLPGRFSMTEVPQTPHKPRLNTANGVFFSPSRRIRSEIPSSIRPQTERVASGVTSRAEMPVPPVLTTNRAFRARSRSAFWIAPWSSAPPRDSTTVK